ncbi:MAG: hypothetical protein WA151_02965, partial [Desulfatirhabdiaceae bacterium]
GTTILADAVLDEVSLTRMPIKIEPSVIPHVEVAPLMGDLPYARYRAVLQGNEPAGPFVCKNGMGDK